MMWLAKKIDLAIKILFYLLFFLAPLVFTKVNYELFEFNKMVLTYLVTILLTGLFLIKGLIKGRIKIKRTAIDLFLLLFLVSQLLSTIFSIDLHVSIFGYYSRFNQGLLSTVSYLILFYILVSTVGVEEKEKRIKFVRNLINISFLAGFICSLIGIMEHYGKDPMCLLISGQLSVDCWVQDVANRVYATMGQPNWLAAYLVILIAIALFLFLEKVKEKKFLSAFLYGGLVWIYYLGLTFTKSRSGFAGLGVVVFLGGLLIWYWLRERKKERKLISIGSGIILMGFILISSGWGVPFEKVNRLLSLKGEKKQKEVKKEKEEKEVINISESGDIRKTVWKGAVNTFLAHPLFGSGVETFAYSYYIYKPKEQNLLSEWDFIYNKAHNEYLNYLATTGLFGFLSYLGVILGVCLFAIRKISRELKEKRENYLGWGLFLGYISILVTNFFGFSVVVVALYFYLIFGFLFLVYDEEERVLVIGGEKEKEMTSFRMLGIFSTGILVFFFLLKLYSFWLADVKFSRADNLVKAQDYVGAYENYLEAINLNPIEPYYRSEMSYTAAVLSVFAYEAKEATVSAEFLNQALRQSQKAMKESEFNIPFYKTRTKILHLLSVVNPHYNKEAIATLGKAHKLAPNDAKITYNLGLLYEHEGDYKKAETYFKKAIRLKPNYREVYIDLADLYWEMEEKEKAGNYLKYVLKRINREDKEVLEKMEKWGIDYEKSN